MQYAYWSRNILWFSLDEGKCFEKGGVVECVYSASNAPAFAREMKCATSICLGKTKVHAIDVWE